MKLIGSLAIAIISLMPQILQGQDSTQMKTRSVQVGFITPLGSNGFNSGNIVNKFSVNLLAGYAGGVDGAEFSGLVSVLRNSMTGAQFSGLANINTCKTTGFQASGLANINTDTTRGFQNAGLVNLSKGGKVTQISGLANISTGSIKGLQMAGLINVSTSRVVGAQITGLLNYSDKLNGVQIGVINISDSLERGVPIGFLSFVRNGYKAFEIGATETLYGVLSFKTGTRQFYNILSVGSGSRNGLSLFAWGYGLGTYIPVGKKAGISIDGLCYQVNEGEWFTNRLNLLNKINITGSWRVAAHLSVFAGLSWNVTVSDITDEYGDKVVSHFTPWSVYDETYNGYLNVKMYPGVSMGLRL